MGERALLLFAGLNSSLGRHISHMLLCNLFTVSKYNEGLFVLQYIPVFGYFAGYALVVGWFLFMLCYAVCCRNRENNTLLCANFCFVLAVVAVWGVSEYGLFVYIWDFNVNLESVGATDLLSPEYLSSTNTLRTISTALGVSFVFSIVDHVLSALSV